MEENRLLSNRIKSWILHYVANLSLVTVHRYFNYLIYTLSLSQPVDFHIFHKCGKKRTYTDHKIRDGKRITSTYTIRKIRDIRLNMKRCGNWWFQKDSLEKIGHSLPEQKNRRLQWAKPDRTKNDEDCSPVSIPFSKWYYSCITIILRIF